MEARSVEAQGAGVTEGRTGWVDEALAAAEVLRADWSCGAVGELVAAARATWGRVLFPKARTDLWRYTDPQLFGSGPFSVRGQRAAEFAQDGASLLARFSVPGVDVYRMVWIDGVFQSQLSTLSDVSGVTVWRCAAPRAASSKAPTPATVLGWSDLHRQEPFAALSTALMTDGVVIEIAAGASVERPIHFVHLVTDGGVGAIVTPRVCLEVGGGARVSVIETYGAATSGRYLALPLTEVRAHSGAVVDYVQLQQHSESALQVASLAVEQHRDAVVRSFLLSVGGGVVRNNVQVALKGSNTSAVLNGLSVLRGAQHIDNATVIHHIEPHAESREHFKGVYADQSRGVFSGTITVEREAQKTNAFQSNQAVLLSSSASIESRPQLKIWADDVKCTHGATVGQLDADALFYLRSRGIDHQVARNLLLHAFASDVLTMLEPGAIRNHVEAILTARLDGLAAAA